MSFVNNTVLAEMAKDKDESFNVNDNLGLQYKRFRKSLYSLSLSKPSVYYDLQEKVTNQIKTRMVTSVYKDVYELLRFGKINEVSIFHDTNVPPCGVPSNKVKESSVCVIDIASSFTLLLGTPHGGTFVS